MACTQLKLQQAPPMCGAYSLGERSGSQGTCGGLTNREDDAGLQALQCGLQIRRAAGDLLVRRTTVPRWSTADHVGADVEVYLGEYRRFLRWCEDQAREPTFDTLLDYRAGLDNITVKSKTRYRRGISIAAVVWAAFQREIPPPPPPRPSRDIPSRPDIRSVLLRLDGFPFLAGALAYGAGLTVAELVEL